MRSGTGRLVEQGLVSPATVRAVAVRDRWDRLRAAGTRSPAELLWFAAPSRAATMARLLAHRGALAGALVVGLTRAAAISMYAELEVLAIYLIVIVVLVARPAGLFGKAVE